MAGVLSSSSSTKKRNGGVLSSTNITPNVNLTPNKPNLAMFNRVTPEDKLQIEALQPKPTFLDNVLSNIGQTEEVGRQNTEMVDKINRENIVMPVLDIMQRPANAVVNTMAELRPTYDQEGNLIPTQKTFDVGGSFMRGLTGQERPSSLEAAMSKQDVEAFKAKDPTAAGALEFATGVALDPLTYPIGGVFAKGAKKAISAVKDIGKTAVKETVEELPKAVGKTISETAATKLDNVSDIPISTAGREPKNIPIDEVERGFSRNIRTDVNNPDELRNIFSDNPETYTQINGKDTLEKANSILALGDETATAELYKSIGKNEYRPEMVPVSKMLARNAANKGDMKTAREILSNMATKLTEAGQFTQAARLLRESDPETFIMTIDKQLKKLNEQGAKQYGKKWSQIDLTQDELNAIGKIPRGDQAAYEATWEQIGNRIAKELPSTSMEKFDAWRRIAMLLNPKTHVRNVIGNTIMMGMRKASDTIGAALEKAFVPVGERTKSIGWSFDKSIVSKVDEAWEAGKKDLLGESRWEIDNLKALGREKDVFKTKWLQGLNEASLKSLNWEDNLFVKRAYKDALGQFIKANGLEGVTDAAQAYAKRRAMEATFKQTNWLSSIIQQGKSLPVAGKLIEGAIPFSKTPANIAARAFEYSPGGLFKALYSKASGKTSATVIEDLSKGLTGTATAALGFGLASMGWAKANRSKSDNAEGIAREAGEQPYSINTPLGSYTFDWAQPFAVPLAMGMAMYESLEKRKDGDGAIEAVINGLAAGGDTIFNMTMLRNIKDILGSGESPTQKIMGIPLAYIEQAIPSFFGQVGRSIDGTVKNTYDPNPAKQELNKIQQKFGVSAGLEPKLNVFGNEQKQPGPLTQFLSPGTPLANSKNPAAIELNRLYSSTKETDFLPKLEDGKFSDKGIEYNLSPKQLTQFQRDMGQANYQTISTKINTPEYKNATDDAKAKMIRSIVTKNYDRAKEKALKELKAGQK